MMNRRLLPILIAVISVTAIGFIAMSLITLNVTSSTMNPQQSAIGLIENSALRLSDLPATWIKTEHVDANTSEATGRFYRFYIADDPAHTWINIGEKILIFANKDKAKSGFEEWKSKYTSVDKIADQKIDIGFTPQADEFAMRCLPIAVNDIPTLDCAVVARYQNITVLLMTSVFRDRWLTMTDYQSVLATMDRRIIEALTK